MTDSKEYYFTTEEEAVIAQADLLVKCKAAIKCDACDPESENYAGRKANNCPCNQHFNNTIAFSEIRQSKDGYWTFTASPSLSNVYPIRYVDQDNYIN